MKLILDKIKKEIVFSDYDGTIYVTEEDMEKNIMDIRLKLLKKR